MFAIAVILTFLFYLIITIVLVLLVSRSARKRGIKGWKWGLPAAIGMYLLVFWDWLPMEVMISYKCSNDAGYVQYKTVDEWKLENPGVWETLDHKWLPKKYLVKIKKGAKQSKREHYKLPDGTELVARYDAGGKYMTTNISSNDGIVRSLLNQRFTWELERISHPFHIRETDEKIIDRKTGKVIAQYIDFSTDILPIGIGSDDLSDYKFWMQKRSCEKDRSSRKRFGEFTHFIQHHKRIEL